MILLASALVFTGPALFLLKRALVGRPLATGRCWRCRFDLAGLPDAGQVCPECGAPVVPPGQRPPTDRRERVTGVFLAMVLLLPVFSIGLARWPRTEWWRRKFVVQDRGAQAMASFLAGEASEVEMRDAVRAAVFTLAEQPMPPLFDSPGVTGPRLISGSEGGVALQAIAAALNDRKVPEDRLGLLLDAVADAYEAVPVGCTTMIDEVLCGLIAGSWVGRNEDRLSSRPPPRALPPEQVQRLLEMVLTVQGDGSRLWNQRWGMAFEAAIRRGAVPEALIRRYLEQSFNPRIAVHAGTSVRHGDALFFDIEPGWKTGESIPAAVRVESPPAPLEGRVTGDVVCGIVWDTSIGSFRFEGVLLLPDRPGPLEVELPVTASFGPAVNAAYGALRHDMKPAWGALPAVRVIKPARLRLTLIENETPTTVEQSSGLSAEFVRAGLGEAACAYDTGGPSVLFEVRIGVARPPIALAGDVVLRQGSVERALGWVFAPRIGVDSVRALGTADGIDPAQLVEVVLRSRRGPIERSFWTREVWEGELVLGRVRPEPAPLLPLNGGR